MITADSDVVRVADDRVEVSHVDAEIGVGCVGGEVGHAPEGIEDGIETRRRDDVAAEGQTDSRGVGGRRIINIGLLSGAVDDVVEVASPHRLGGDSAFRIGLLARAQTFVSEEPEALVPAVIDLRDQYGTTCGCSEFIAGEERGRIAVLAAPTDEARSIVAECLKHRAVELVGAAVGHHRDRARAGELCARPDGFNAELLDDVQSRCDAGNAAAEAVDQRNAIQGHFGSAHLQSVDAGIAAAFDTWSQVEQICDGTAVQGQLLDSDRIFHVAQLRTLRGAGDFNDRIDAANLESWIDDSRLAGFQADVGRPLLESLKLSRELVLAGGDTSKQVDTQFVGGGLPRNIGAGLDQHDLRVWDSGAGGIEHGSADDACAGLRECGDCEANQQCRQKQRTPKFYTHSELPQC